MGLVNDDDGVFAQEPIALNFRQQDAVGHEFDLGGRAHMTGEADLETHLLANFHAEFAGDAFGHGACGEAARLGVANEALLGQPQFHAHLGDLGGLSRTGFAGDDGDLVGCDRGHDVLAALRDRQRGRISNSQSHGATSLCRYWYRSPFAHCGADTEGSFGSQHQKYDAGYAR